MDFDTDGAVHLRGVYDVGLIDRVRAAAEEVISQRPSFERPKLPIRDILIDGTPGDIALGSPAVVDIARRYLGHEPQPCGISNVRRMLPSSKPLPFHQDETLLGHRLLNVWVPLTDCGSDAPGLQVVLGSWRELLDTVSIPDSPMIAERQHIAEARVLSAFPADAFYAPEFLAGDAMVFKGSTIHRTLVKSGMTRSRLSVELRLM